MNESSEALPVAAHAGEAPPDPDATGADERPSLSRSVGQAAGLIGSEGLSNGDRAALRRISPDAPFTPALWNVLHRLGQQDTPGPLRQKTWERRWATLLMGLAFCAEPGRNLHEYDVPMGRALFEAGWSELRFVRLLRSTGEGLEVELRRVAQYLASKAQPANWADAAYLLFYQHDDAAGETAEDIRLSIARDYYGARYRSEQQDE
jgi:CRISPR system Cascade subunit CasB